MKGRVVSSDDEVWRREFGTGPARPSVPSVPGGWDRPLWSVMIPTYEPSAYLEETVRSVLDQDPGPAVMQIAIVDDASPSDRAKAVVDRLAPDRIEFIRQPANIGLARNWNTCIERSRGRWVHILHQDDLVLSGFYESLGQAAAACPEAGAVFCRHAFIAPDGHWNGLSQLESRESGFLDGWLERICEGQRLQCPSIVVRREVYEELGGYDPSLKYVLDWEMWVRIASRHRFYYDPRILACYRIHPSSETSRLEKQQLISQDCKAGIELVRSHVPPRFTDRVGRELIKFLTGRIMMAASSRFGEGDLIGGLSHLREACSLDPSLQWSKTWWTYHFWAFKILGRRLLGRLMGSRNMANHGRIRAGAS